MTREFNKRIFTIKENTKILNRAAKGLGFLLYAKKHKLFNKKFKERIMLAVTEVNGCELCSYIHTKIALSSGMKRSEISDILDGGKSNIPDEEIVGVLFAQHYADSHEHPDKEAINSLIEEYGREKAKIICSILAVITLTNSMGISMGLFKDRILLRRVKKSKLINEIGIPLLTIIIFPMLFIFHKIKTIFGTSECNLITT